MNLNRIKKVFSNSKYKNTEMQYTLIVMIWKA